MQDQDKPAEKLIDGHSSQSYRGQRGQNYPRRHNAAQ